MTREPDRFYATAEVILESLRDALPATTDEQIDIIAAALRQATDEALNEVRQYVDASPMCSQRTMLRLLDDLAHPVAAPAAEPEPVIDALGRATPAPPQGPGMLDVLRAYGAEPVAPADPCRAEVSSRFPDYTHYECTLRKGHTGPHKEGSFAEWTDATTFEEPPAP